jgi:multiple sugar transport system substrate-binding protein
MFIRYVLDNSLEWARAGSVPALNDVRNSPEFMELSHAVVAPSAENPVFPPSIPGIGDAFAPLGEAVGAVMSGTATDIQQTLDDAAARANQILEENRRTYGDAPGNQ